MATLVSPKQLTTNNLPECERPPTDMIVYVCPTKGCGNFYASPDFRPDRSDVSAMQYHRSQNDGNMTASHPRIDCPDCREHGKKVQRVPYVVTQVVPLNDVLKVLAKEKENASSDKST